MSNALEISSVLSGSNEFTKTLSAKHLFKPSSRGFFHFADGMLSYRGEPGTEAALFVDKASFPEGLNLLAFELLGFSRHTLDWSFELVIERLGGGSSRLTPFDLAQIHRRAFSFPTEVFSNIVALRFNNLGAVIPTAFSIGLLILRY